MRADPRPTAVLSPNQSGRGSAVHGCHTSDVYPVERGRRPRPPEGEAVAACDGLPPALIRV